MPEAERAEQRLIEMELWRRELLRGGLIAGSAAFLVACGSSAASPSAAAPTIGAIGGGHDRAERGTDDGTLGGRFGCSEQLRPRALRRRRRPRCQARPRRAENFQGVTLKVWTTLTPEQLVKNAKAIWEPTHGRHGQHHHARLRRRARSSTRA